MYSKDIPLLQNVYSPLQTGRYPLLNRNNQRKLKIINQRSLSKVCRLIVSVKELFNFITDWYWGNGLRIYRSTRNHEFQPELVARGKSVDFIQQKGFSDYLDATFCPSSSFLFSFVYFNRSCKGKIPLHNTWSGII